MEPKDIEGKSPEEIIALIQEKDEALQKAEADKTATVGELKDLRAKKQELEKSLEESKKPQTTEPEAQTTEEQFEAFLQKKQQEEAKANREKAIEEFRASNHEFSEAADPGGIKFAAFERELKKFNLSDLSSTDDFKSRFREVHDFMNRGEKPDETVNTYKGTQKAPAEPPSGNEKALDAVEKKLIDNMGWSVDRYLALKEKMPAYIEQQLSYQR